MISAVLKLEKSDKARWYLAYNSEEGPIHCGCLDPGLVLETGCKTLEIFSSERAYEDRFKKAGLAFIEARKLGLDIPAQEHIIGEADESHP